MENKKEEEAATKSRGERGVIVTGANGCGGKESEEQGREKKEGGETVRDEYEGRG